MKRGNSRVWGLNVWRGCEMKHIPSVSLWLISQTSRASITCTYFNVIYCVQMTIKHNCSTFHGEDVDFIYEKVKTNTVWSVSRSSNPRLNQLITVNNFYYGKFVSWRRFQCVTRSICTNSLSSVQSDHRSHHSYRILTGQKYRQPQATNQSISCQTLNEPANINILFHHFDST